MRAGLALLLFVSSCTPQGQCETKARVYCGPDDNTCAGRLLDPYTWESNPIGDGWVPYDGQTQYTMNVRDKSGATIQGRIFKITSYIATNVYGTDGTQTAGNLTEEIQIGPAQIRVWNQTCANYYVRVVVEARPESVDAGVSDASASDVAAQ